MATSAIGKRATKSRTLMSLLEEYKHGFSMNFVTFDASLKTANFEDLYGMGLGWLRKGRVGSTFLSNFNRTFYTTPFHSAFTESFAYQCEGTKRWNVMTPEDAFPTVRYHNLYTAMKDCNGRKDIEALTFDVYTTKDSMFYFPPFWAHSVETERGLSVLLNYRGLNIRRLLWESPKVGIITVTSILYHMVFFLKWDPDEITYYYLTGIKPHLTGAKMKGNWL